ncbi:hypothetical protein QTP88_017758 [Uroleucon formosanum]
MNHYFWASSLLLFAAVQYSAVAFKIPGLSSGSSSINRTPPVRGPATNAGGHRGPESEYMGPVFIIRELDKDKGEYDAFVTTGGIQEVRPPPMSDRSLPPQHSKPSAARDDEDAEHFGVLVTPETVKRLDHDEKLRVASINVTMAVLLSAASSRMPWLLVLHRKQYPHLFEYQQQQPQHQYQVHPQQQQQHQPHQQQQPQQYPQQQQHQQQQPQYLQPAQSESVQVDSGMPGLQHPQIPQRRRYQMDRQRRSILHSSPDDSRTPLMMAFEQQLLSTMCYNFVRDYYSSPAAQKPSSAEQLPRLPIALVDTDYGRSEDRREREPEPEQYGRYQQGVYLDTDAYAAAATAPSEQQSPPQPQPTSSTVRPEERSDGVVVGMEIPKRVS